MGFPHLELAQEVGRQHQAVLEVELEVEGADLDGGRPEPLPVRVAVRALQRIDTRVILGEQIETLSLPLLAVSRAWSCLAPWGVFAQWKGLVLALEKVPPIA